MNTREIKAAWRHWQHTIRLSVHLTDKMLTRSRTFGLLALAAIVGAIAGLLVAGMSWIVHELHIFLFQLPAGMNLSAMPALSSNKLALVPAAGGLLLGITFLLTRRFRRRQPVDPIEANALHGGRMSMNDSLLVAFQTIISSGFGASVGLEAGYTQMGAGVASRLARALSLRRSEVRMLVGCGAAGAISAAFGAPLTGAFYGFELIIGIYSVALVAPVLTASLSGYITASLLHAVQNRIEVGAVPAMGPWDYLPFLALGILSGLVAVAVMQLVTVIERGFARTACPAWLRPTFGGLLVGGLALAAPQVLSTGHGALHMELESQEALSALVIIFLMKALAAAFSLGSGFRGGLFFTSLFLGALLGKIFALIMISTNIDAGIPIEMTALVGMASLAVGIVGGPLTMTFLVLETTGDLTITGAVLAASIASAVIVRETFGYSFSTWRLHLRGETIRSAQDIGWMRSLKVGAMMRADVKTFPIDGTLAGFREAYPLGSTQRVVMVDDEGNYAGILLVADAYHSDLQEPKDDAGILQQLAILKGDVLYPDMNVKEAALLFEKTKSEELAVVERYSENRLAGLLTESHLMRRYAEELEKARNDLSGENQ